VFLLACLTALPALPVLRFEFPSPLSWHPFGKKMCHLDCLLLALLDYIAARWRKADCFSRKIEEVDSGNASVFRA
jgi:hypothetical protein